MAPKHRSGASKPPSSRRRSHPPPSVPGPGTSQPALPPRPRASASGSSPDRPPPRYTSAPSQSSPGFFHRFISSRSSSHPVLGVLAPAERRRRQDEAALARVAAATGACAGESDGGGAGEVARAALGVLFDVFRRAAKGYYEREYARGRRFPWSPRVFRDCPEDDKNCRREWPTIASRYCFGMDQLISVPIPGLQQRLPIGLGFPLKLVPAAGTAGTLLTSTSIYYLSAQRARVPLDPILKRAMGCMLVERALSLAPGFGSFLSLPIQSELHCLSAIQHFILLRFHSRGDEWCEEQGLWRSDALRDMMRVSQPVWYSDAVRGLIHPGGGQSKV